jgi:hypothetical protein
VDVPGEGGPVPGVPSLGVPKGVPDGVAPGVGAWPDDVPVPVGDGLGVVEGLAVLDAAGVRVGTGVCERVRVYDGAGDWLLPERTFPVWLAGVV